MKPMKNIKHSADLSNRESSSLPCSGLALQCERTSTPWRETTQPISCKPIHSQSRQQGNAKRWFLIALIGLLLTACGLAESDQSHHLEQPASLTGNSDRICVIGDPGTGDNTQYAVARALETMHCSQLRILGDLIYPSGITSPSDPLLEKHLLKPYHYFIQHKIPIYLILGNHDHKQNSEAWLEVARQHPSIHFPNFYYSEHWGPICFFNIDSSFYDKIYYLHKRLPQTHWLRRAMQRQQKSCRFSIAAGHHPYISSGSHGAASWQLAKVLKEEIFGSVDLYLAGHDHHLSDEGEVDGTRQLISGSAGLLYELGEPSETKQFAASKPGFLTLDFKQQPDGKIALDYNFYAVKPDNKGGYRAIEKVWHGTMRGQGLRLKEDQP